MFTLMKPDVKKSEFARQVSRLLGSALPVTFLFCIREDYLPDLYNLSQLIPDLYERNNTFRLHRLSRENGLEVFVRAAQFARSRLSTHIARRVVDELCKEGEGMIYPPFLQIVGYRLYGSLSKYPEMIEGADESSEITYETAFGNIRVIVNRYLDELLDHYRPRERSTIAAILRKMVTEHYTKKRVTKAQLRNELPECHNLDSLLGSLVTYRILRRSLGEYELIHDFLGQRVIDYIEEGRFISTPVRRALRYISKNYDRPGLTVRDIAKAARVSQPYLALLFREQVHTTVKRKLNEIRIARAKELLSSESIKFIDIARLTGFSSLSAFSRKFGEVEGISPREYRNEIIASFHVAKDLAAS